MIVALLFTQGGEAVNLYDAIAWYDRVVHVVVPLLAALPAEARAGLAASMPFPPRLGRPEEFADLACEIVRNTMLNGEVIRLDGALRMAPR